MHIIMARLPSIHLLWIFYLGLIYHIISSLSHYFSHYLLSIFFSHELKNTSIITATQYVTKTPYLPFAVIQPYFVAPGNRSVSSGTRSQTTTTSSAQGQAAPASDTAHVAGTAASNVTGASNTSSTAADTSNSSTTTSSSSSSSGSRSSRNRSHNSGTGSNSRSSRHRGQHQDPPTHIMAFYDPFLPCNSNLFIQDAPRQSTSGTSNSRAPVDPTVGPTRDGATPANNLGQRLATFMAANNIDIANSPITRFTTGTAMPSAADVIQRNSEQGAQMLADVIDDLPSAHAQPSADQSLASDSVDQVAVDDEVFYSCKQHCLLNYSLIGSFIV